MKKRLVILVGICIFTLLLLLLSMLVPPTSIIETPADVVYDPVGGELFDPAFSSTGWGGRYLVIGFAGGLQKIPATRILVKHRAVLGSSLRYFRWYAPEKLETSAKALSDWHNAGQLKPLVTHTLPLEKTIDAIKLLTDRKAHGKLIVTP